MRSFRWRMQRGFAFGANRDIKLFIMGAGCADTEIHEMLNTSSFAAAIAPRAAGPLDGLKFRSFCWARMCHAHELDEGVARHNMIGIRRGVQRIAGDWLTAGGKFAFAAGTHQSAHVVFAFNQGMKQRPADVTSASGYENRTGGHIFDTYGNCEWILIAGPAEMAQVSLRGDFFQHHPCNQLLVDISFQGLHEEFSKVSGGLR